MRIKIVADENIAALADCFAGTGQLVSAPGREITPALVRDADALLVRSVTPVGEALLDGSSVRFVGTATSGLDHVDRAYLEARGIAFAHAAGANANSVVEYFFCALAALQVRLGRPWLGRSVGIIGAGNIGGLLARRLEALGFHISVYDPYLVCGGGRLGTLRDALRQDIVTLHTPLTVEDAWPTLHMIDAGVIEALSGEQVLINAARGAVVDNAALLARLRRGGPAVVLDAWEGEPEVELELLRRVAIATPHIAGYSQDGKRRGTALIRAAFGRHFGLPEAPGGAAPAAEFSIDASACASPAAVLDHCLLSAYDILADDARMRALADSPRPGKQFDLLRKHYPVRREFRHYRVENVRDGEARRMLSVLGFEVV